MRIVKSYPFSRYSPCTETEIVPTVRKPDTIAENESQDRACLHRFIRNFTPIRDGDGTVTSLYENTGRCVRHAAGLKGCEYRRSSLATAETMIN